MWPTLVKISKPKSSFWGNKVRAVCIFISTVVGVDNLMEFLDVGKTSFVVVFNPEGSSEGRNKLNCVSSTIGASFVTCRVRVKEKSVRMQVGVSVASLLLQSN